MHLLEKTILIEREADVALARLAGGDIADKVGFGIVNKYCTITSISELASNIHRYAGKGYITVRMVVRNDGEKGIEILAQDLGQGIENVELALNGGLPSLGGLRSGLSGVKRLMSEMEVSSASGQGTLVRAIKWMSEPPLAWHERTD